MSEEKVSVHAPNDPEKSREFFYIIKDKDIFSLPEGEGGIQYINLDAGRLINSASIVGNIEDEKILDKLKTMEGFQSLVHSIGVSVELPEDSMEVEFVFEVYGKKDKYGAKKLSLKLAGDGLERRIYLDQYTFGEDDIEPGQILIRFKEKEVLGKLNVRFYVKDGFHLPLYKEENPVDVSLKAYRQMISKSLMSLGNPTRLKNALKKARTEKTSIAFIGGSITQGAGATPIHTDCYAYHTYRQYEETFSKEGWVDFIKAGVGGTPSQFGMIRFDRDVLREDKKPDIIVIEFAVNDGDDETAGNCYESLVRKALKLPWKPAVILLFSVFANDWNLQDRLRGVGEKYALPMVSILDAVVPEFKAKEKGFISRNQFFYDMFHPSNLGHKIMADSLIHLMKEVDEKELEDTSYESFLEKALLQAPAIGNSFDDIKLLDRKEGYSKAVIVEGGFCEQDTLLQCVEMDDSLVTTAEFPYNWKYVGDKNPVFTMDIYCKSLHLVFKDSGDVRAGRANIYVDDKFLKTLDPKEVGWTHAHATLLFDEPISKNHRIRIKMHEEDYQKTFTILGFGYVE
ncbi:MAG TPA: SGNH/GDSL hydrolase family protein [Lachnospiraceae bacterium]